MAGLEITRDPAALALLFTEDLYAVAEKAPLLPEKATLSAENTPPAGGQQEADASDTGSEQAGLQEKAAAQKREEVFHYLGENKRFTLVLVNYPEEEYMPEAEKAYLEKVLSAVKLTLDDIALLNYARYSDRKYTDLKDFFAFTTLLLFGVAPGLLHIPGPVLPYHLGLVEGVKILAADSTEVFRPDNGKKKPLWSELQKTFS